MVKKTIGRVDKADFPDLHLEEIDVKIDSGAYTSSIHCSQAEEIIHNGVKCIKFNLLDASHPLFHQKEFIEPDYSVKKVTSSNGLSEERFVIRTTIYIFKELYPIELTLTERQSMRYPILLGRKFLNKKFVIDSSKTNLSYKEKSNS